MPPLDRNNMSTALASVGPAKVPGLPIHTIAVLVRNQPGVLVRVSLVFARRGYNIESLVVSADVTNGEFSRMTITCRGDRGTLEQIIKQLTKLIDVVHALDHTGAAVIETEIALCKLECAVNQRTEILQVAAQFGAKIVDSGATSMVVRIYGTSDKLDACLSLLTHYRIVELVRSGKILMTRGLETT